MRNFMNSLKSDVKFQLRQGFYYIYIVVTILYLIILFQLDKNTLRAVAPLLIFSDPSVLGFLFIGGIILLEKQQGILDYLTITPLSITGYIYSKVFSLTIISVVVSLAIAISVGLSFNVLLLVLGIVLTGSIFTLVGIYAVSGCSTINQYFAIIVPYILVLVAPALGFLDFKFNFLFSIFPTYAGLKLVFGAYNGINTISASLNIICLILWNILCYLLTATKFQKKVIYGE